MKLTPEQLREIAERAEQATPGPWLKGMWNGRCHLNHSTSYHPGHPFCQYDFTLDEEPPVVSLSQENHVLISGDESGWILSQRDATFIATSRTDIPHLLAHIKELEEENECLRKLIHDTANALTQTQLRLKDDDEMLCERNYDAYVTEYVFSRAEIVQMLQEKGADNQ